MDVDVVESDSVRLRPSSAHAPDLVAALIVVPMLVVSRVWHCEGPVFVGEWIDWEVFEISIAEFVGILKPAIDLAFESPVEDFVGCGIEQVLSDPFKALSDVTVRSRVVFVEATAFGLIKDGGAI